MAAGGRGSLSVLGALALGLVLGACQDRDRDTQARELEVKRESGGCSHDPLSAHPCLDAMMVRGPADDGASDEPGIGGSGEQGAADCEHDPDAENPCLDAYLDVPE